VDYSYHIIVLLIFYFIPAIIAALRKHHNQNPIFLLNLFLGWTLLGWVAALIWSFTAIAPQAAGAAAVMNGPINVETPKTCQWCMALNSRAFRHCTECGKPLPR